MFRSAFLLIACLSIPTLLPASVAGWQPVPPDGLSPLDPGLPVPIKGVVPCADAAACAEIVHRSVRNLPPPPCPGCLVPPVPCVGCVVPPVPCVGCAVPPVAVPPVNAAAVAPSVGPNGVEAMCDIVGSKCVAAIAFAGGGCALAKAPVWYFGSYNVQACASMAETAVFGAAYGIPAGSVLGIANVNHVSGTTTRRYTQTANCEVVLLTWRGCGNTAGALVPDSNQCLQANGYIRATNGVPEPVEAKVAKATSACASARTLGLAATVAMEQPLNNTHSGWVVMVPADVLDEATRAELVTLLQEQFLADFDRATASWDAHPVLSAWKPLVKAEMLQRISLAEGEVALREA